MTHSSTLLLIWQLTCAIIALLFVAFIMTIFGKQTNCWRQLCLYNSSEDSPSLKRFYILSIIVGLSVFCRTSVYISICLCRHFGYDTYHYFGVFLICIFETTGFVAAELTYIHRLFHTFKGTILAVDNKWYWILLCLSIFAVTINVIGMVIDVISDGDRTLPMVLFISSWMLLILIFVGVTSQFCKKLLKLLKIQHFMIESAICNNKYRSRLSVNGKEPDMDIIRIVTKTCVLSVLQLIPGVLFVFVMFIRILVLV